MPRSDDATVTKPAAVPGETPPAPFRRAAAARLKRDGAAPQLLDIAVAVEAPVALSYNGLPHVVMMATPQDLEDFALGFSLSEGLLHSPAELLDLAVTTDESGIQINMGIPFARFSAISARQRNLTGRTGCGVCGVDTLDQVTRPLPRLADGPAIDPAAIHRALDALPTLQAITRQTGAAHAAAWASRDGTIALVREDVGRHNALDKLVGALAAAAVDPADGFAIITSRCSFEMVQKAATVGIRTLAAISAPTSLALDIATEAGMTLVALARADSITVYANPGRVAAARRGD
jgi:formate dehydrogenase accessory protein FdhD